MVSRRLLLIGLFTIFIAKTVHGSLLNYLEDFETLKKEHIYLEKISNFTSLTAAKFYVRIDINSKVFHCALQPHIDLFHPEVVVKHRSEKLERGGSLDILEFLEGSIIDIPKSRVLIHIRDHIVTGSIQVSDQEKYFIEPSVRHISKPHDFHMIAYKQSDIKFNITSKHGHFCGHESHMHNKNDLHKDNTFQFPKETVTDGFEYSRKRRSTSTKNRCSLALVADYLFYSNICAKDEEYATSYMISLVQQVDALYKAQSLDPNEDAAYKGYGFQIKYVEVVTTPLTASADSSSYKYYSENHSPGVSDLLTNFAYGNWGDYCLAHLFTNYDFDSGVLGLAFIASSSTSSVGGVCTRSYTDGTGQKKYTNVGLSTTVNYGRTLLTSEVVFVTGHEFGHNWGSSHDSDSSEECAPDNNRFLMYPAAVDGSQSNNYLFSSCSKKAINDVLVAKSSLCFEEAVTHVCGNGVVEESEECDSGMNSSDCCSGCKFTSGSVCEDSNSECCTGCQWKPIGSVCLSTDWQDENSKHCVSQFTCNSQG
ncbi:hypothetical protein ACHWQZ_G010947 [Mnemiopsis leidyi]